MGSSMKPVVDYCGKALCHSSDSTAARRMYSVDLMIKVSVGHYCISENFTFKGLMSWGIHVHEMYT